MSSITSSDSFTLSSARLNKPQGWISAETPFSAIPRSNWSPESADVRPLLQKRLVRMGPGFPRGTGLQLMQFNLNKKMKTRSTSNPGRLSRSFYTSFLVITIACLSVGS